jgi:predicted component of type VI protein secretion system
MVAVLHQLGGGRVIAIDRAVILVGRAADCDVVITASQKISRRHCCLVQVDNTYYLRDLGSMNGVWLNGNRVNREAPMSIGDKVTIGDVEFQFHPNARIEKKAQAPPTNKAPSTNDSASASRRRSPNVGVVQPLPNADILEAEIIDEFEVIDDVIPLSETNEVEIIDQPIVDLDGYDSFDGDVIPLDD